MKVDVILGLQWGDEGKGKIVDALSPNYDIIARFQGGPNAGHTLEFDGQKHVLHTIPSGIFHKRITNVIGNGVLIDPFVFMKEVRLLREKGHEPVENLKISQKTHLILPSHRMMDIVLEQAKGAAKIGSTLKGIGPTYTDKTGRHGLRIGDIFEDSFLSRYENLKASHIKQFECYGSDWKNQKIENLSFEDYEKEWLKAIEQIKEFDIIACEYFLNDALNNNKRILAEGAQGTLLDVDFGSYPFVTSSNTTTAGVCTGLGIAPSRIGKVYGIFKAYCTRVGSGPFPTELQDEIGEHLRKNGHEFGATTGRPRRCGWLDMPALHYAIMLNGVTDLIVTKIDVLNDFETIEICDAYDSENTQTTQFVNTLKLEKVKPVLKSFAGWNQPIDRIKDYEKLPKQIHDYLAFVETQTKVKVNIVSIGPDRLETIYR